MPPSPKRKGSASSESEARDKGSVGSGASGRSPFPFGFGGGNVKTSPSVISIPDGQVSQGPSSPTLLAPPTIIEPDNNGDDNNKRASQMVHHSGFINRMTDFSPSMLNNRAHQAYMAGAPPAVLAKGWKPFKLVLKGSKLYFYKPPSDRTAGIRELFPTELVSVLETETGDPELDVDIHDAEIDMAGRGGGKGKEREELRRRRAYWGRGTHPSLVVGNGIERGSTEAIVHEAVFATTFAVPQAVPSGTAAQSDSDKQSSSSSRYKPEWRDFAAAVLFALPVLAGQAAFETEFYRSASNLVNGGADDALREEEVKRVEWLTAQYLDYHGAPANQEAWDSWCKETIASTVSPASVASTLAKVKLSGDSASADPGSAFPSQSGPGTEETSPNLGTFSPRPSDSRMQSIVEALGENQRPPPTAFSPDALRNALEEEGLSRDILLSLDPALIARSLFVFHKAAFQRLPDKFFADAVGGSRSRDSAAKSTAPFLLPFLGSDEWPHWLTRLVLIQVLVPEPACAVHMPSHDGRGPQPPRAHSRSEVISAWVRIGESARRNGDECSWRAIMAALCSRPIARLDKVWKRVDPEALSAAQGWTQILVRGDQPTATAPLAFPWAGDDEREIREALEKARDGVGEEWVVGSLRTAREAFDKLRTTFALCTRQGSEGESVPEPPAVDVLVRHWNTLASDPESRGLAAKFLRYAFFVTFFF